MNRLIRFKCASLIITLVMACCATTNNFQKGEEAFEIKNWDEAVEYFFKALQDDPKNPRIRLSLAKAYIMASKYHCELGETFYQKGDKRLALLEFQKALDTYPENQRARIRKNEILKESAILEERKRALTELELAAKKLEEAEEVKHALSVDPEIKFDLKFREALLYDIFNALQKIGGINILLDEHILNKQISVDISNVTFEKALENLTLSNTLYYKIIDKNNIIVIPDNPEKRKQYDELAVKTFYPSHVNVQELMGYLKTITKTEAIAMNMMLNSITFRDTPGRIEIAERIIKALDKPRGDILVDIEVIEVNKSRMHEYGLDLSNFQLTAGVVSDNDALEAGVIGGDELSDLTTANLLFSIPSMIFKFLSSDTKSRHIASPQVRVKSNEQAQVKIGDKVPVPITSFVPMSAGGLAQQPITSYQYENVGISIDITPTLHTDNSITLDIMFELTFITSAGSATTPPTLGNRTVNSVVRLKDGDTNILAGLLRDEERKSLRGIPGIKDIPILNSLFAANTREITQTDIIFTITPRILSYPPITESDISAFWVGPERNMMFKSLIARQEQKEEDGINIPDLEESNIGFSPQNSIVLTETDFLVGLFFDNLADVERADFQIQYDSSVIHAVKIIEGDFLKENEIKIENKSIDNENGTLLISVLKPKDAVTDPGRRILIKIHFSPLQGGKSPLNFTKIVIGSYSGREIPFQYQNGEIVVERD